jgi:hypothetical protein
MSSFWFPFSRHSSSGHRPSYARSSSSQTSGSWVRPRGASSASSYYRRRPRDGYFARLIDKFRHLLRELWYWLRRNPVKVFFMVIMPLISGGALAAFGRQFGVRVPDFLAGRGGGGGGMGDFAREMGGSYYGSRGYGGGEGGGGGDALGSLMNIAKAFI